MASKKESAVQEIPETIPESETEIVGKFDGKIIRDPGTNIETAVISISKSLINIEIMLDELISLTRK